MLTTGLLLGLPGSAAAEWQIKPFLGFTLGGGTTLVDPEHSGEAPSKRHFVFGVTGSQLGEVFGIEGDFTVAPGFFAGEKGLVLRSSVRTLTGSLIAAFPRRLTAYTLRPYFVAGMGSMHVQLETAHLPGAVSVGDTFTAVSVGGGVTGFISDHAGVSWDLRHFSGYGGQPKESALTLPVGADQRLSYWRANMSLALRF